DDARDRLEPVHHRHGEVEEDDVGDAREHDLDALAPVGRLADDVEAAVAVQRAPEQGAQRLRVVDDHHPDASAPGAVHGHGQVAVSVVGVARRRSPGESLLWVPTSPRRSVMMPRAAPRVAVMAASDCACSPRARAIWAAASPWTMLSLISSAWRWRSRMSSKSLAPRISGA